MDLRVVLVDRLFQLLYLLLLIRVVFSWVPSINHDHPAVRFVYQVTSPVLNPIRRVLPPIGGLDLSPLVAILLLSMLKVVIGELFLGF